MSKSLVLRMAVMATLGVTQCAGFAGGAAYAADQQEVEELRNTLVNVLDALVQKGVLTREQAAQIVANAQARTQQAAAEKAKQEREEKDAVRVTFVPENVQQEISSKVADKVKPDVVRQVVEEAKAQGWAVPGAMPQWAKVLTFYGDVRFRAEQTSYAKENEQYAGQGFYLNYNLVNARGTATITNQEDGTNINMTQDRFRVLSRLRVGATAALGNNFRADFRLAGGTGRTAGSTNQTLGDYLGRGGINIDKAALIWNPISRSATQEFELQVGRFDNPFYTPSELVWDADLTFEGVSATYALDAWGRKPDKMERGLSVTLGAIPIQEVELTSKDKWLYGVQVGTAIPFGSKSAFKAAAAYYTFSNMVGIRNEANLFATDYTAPKYFQKGNTVFNIRNSTGASDAALYALASEFRLFNVNASLSFDVFGSHKLMFMGDYVVNRGFDEQEVRSRLGSAGELDSKYKGKHVKGYNYGVSLGDSDMHALLAWKIGLDYRHLEADAVVDAFADSDFHAGGTGAKGYILTGELGLSEHVFLKARYMSTGAISYPDPNVADQFFDPPFDIDTLQLDLNGRF